MTTYSAIRFLHVLIAIFGMGPQVAAMVMVRHVLRRPDSARTVMPILNRVINFPKHGGKLMLLTGLLLVWLNGTGWALLKEFWLWFSLLLFVFAAVFGAIREKQPAAKIAAIVAGEPVQEREVRAVARHLQTTLSVMALSLILIIYLMIFKPH